MPWLESVDDDEEATDYPNGLNSYFNNSGFSNMNILKNMGSSVIYLAFMVAGFLVLLLSIPMKIIIPKISKVFDLLHRQLVWKSTFRFVYQQI